MRETFNILAEKPIRYLLSSLVPKQPPVLRVRKLTRRRIATNDKYGLLKWRYQTTLAPVASWNVRIESTTNVQRFTNYRERTSQITED